MSNRQSEPLKVDVTKDPKFQELKQKIYDELVKTAPGIQGSAKLEGWLDEMLLNFFVELTKKAGELFLLLTDQVKTQLKDLGRKTYESGVTRLNPEAPVNFDKVIDIASDATADAIAKSVILSSSVLALQFIPFLNLTGLNHVLQTISDLSPDHEIARVVTRTMVKGLVADPLQEFHNRKYRSNRISISDARRLYDKNLFSKEDLADLLAYHGITDKDAQVLIAEADLGLQTTIKALKPANEGELVKAYKLDLLDRAELVRRLASIGYEPFKISLVVTIADQEKIKEAAARAEPQDETQVAIKAAQEVTRALKLLDEYEAPDKDIEAFAVIVEERQKKAREAIMRRFARDLSTSERQIRAVRKDMTTKVEDLIPKELQLTEEDQAKLIETQIAIAKKQAAIPFDEVNPDRPTQELKIGKENLSSLDLTLAGYEEDNKMQVPEVEPARPQITIDSVDLSLMGEVISKAPDVETKLQQRKQQQEQETELPINLEDFTGQGA